MAEYAWVGREYAWICVSRAWICLNVSGFTIINRVLNMSYTIHSARSLYKLMSAYWVLIEPCQRSEIERFGKIIIAFNYFCKIRHLQFLRGFWIWVRFWICQGSEYFRIIVLNFHDYTGFTHFHKYDRVLNMH